MKVAETTETTWKRGGIMNLGSVLHTPSALTMDHVLAQHIYIHVCVNDQ